MLYKEIEEYFKTKESTNKLLEKFESIFIDIQEIDDSSRNNEIEGSEIIDQVISRLTSYANQCSLASTIAGTYKTGEQVRLQYEKIRQCGKEKKLNMSQIKEEASYEVHYLRRIRNLFEAYANSAGRSLSSYKAKLVYRQNKNRFNREENK